MTFRRKASSSKSDSGNTIEIDPEPNERVDQALSTTPQIHFDFDNMTLAGMLAPLSTLTHLHLGTVSFDDVYQILSSAPQLLFLSFTASNRSDTLNTCTRIQHDRLQALHIVIESGAHAEALTFTRLASFPSLTSLDISFKQGGQGINSPDPLAYQAKADAFLSSFIAPFRHTLAYLSLQELDGHSPEILSPRALQAVAHQTPNLVQFYAKRHALSKDSEFEAVIAFLTGGDSKPNTATNFDDLLRCIMRYALWPKLQYFRWDCGDSTDISDRALLEFMRSRSGQSYYHDWRVAPLHQIVVTLPRKQNFPISLWDLEGLRYEIGYTDKHYSKDGTTQYLPFGRSGTARGTVGSKIRETSYNASGSHRRYSYGHEC